MATLNHLDRRIMSGWIDDLLETPEGEWPDIDARLTTRTLGELVASRVNGDCQWSTSSEAVYVTSGGRTMRIASHAWGSIGAMAGDHDAPCADVRIGSRHDATSTHLVDEPQSSEEMIEAADRLAAILQKENIHAN
jgi:hypothetical protein